MNAIFRPLFLLISLVLISSSLNAQTINVTPWISGFSSIVGAHWKPNDTLIYVVEQAGKIRRVSKDGQILPIDYADITSKVLSGGERGLLGIAFHPDYSNNGYLYVNYTRKPDGNTVISRFQKGGSISDVIDPTTEKILLVVPQPFSNHNGGQIQFGPDGYLYIGMGDGGSGGDPNNNSQNKKSFLGKMLRIDVNNGDPYGIPPTNPFATNPDYLPEIWALGVRNPWRFTFDRQAGDMWIADVGQDEYEEIDFQAAGDVTGHNYGWRCYEGNEPYNTNGCGAQSEYTFPISVITHSGGNCSVTGGFVYRGSKNPGLKDKYIFTDYCSGNIWAITNNGGGSFTRNDITQENAKIKNALVSFAEDLDGEIYLLGSGRIYKIEETSCILEANVLSSGKTSICNGDSATLVAELNTQADIQWYKDGVPLTGKTTDKLVVLEGGDYSIVATLAGNCADTSDILTITVTTPVVGNFINLPDTICQDDTLQLSAFPGGGSFSGTGITGNIFNAEGLSSGGYTITYAYTDNGCPAQIETQIQVKDCTVIGTFNPVLSKWIISPNPFQSQIAIRTVDYKGPVDLILRDGSAKEIYRKQIKETASGEKIILDGLNLVSGIYFLEIRTKEGNFIKKITRL